MLIASLGCTGYLIPLSLQTCHRYQSKSRVSRFIIISIKKFKVRLGSILIIQVITIHIMPDANYCIACRYTQ